MFLRPLKVSVSILNKFSNEDEDINFKWLFKSLYHILCKQSKQIFVDKVKGWGLSSRVRVLESCIQYYNTIILVFNVQSFAFWSLMH